MLRVLGLSIGEGVMQRIVILLAVLSLVLPGVAFAKLYKCKNNDGEVIYTDKPCEGSGEEMKLPPLPTYTPRAAPAAPGSTNSAAASSKIYKSLEIIKPVNDKLITSLSGTVTLAYKIDGPLLSLKGHRFAVAVDGTKLKTRGITNQIRLDKLDPGTHTVQVFAVDDEDKVLISSNTVSFHMKTKVSQDNPIPGQPSSLPGTPGTVPGSPGTVPGSPGTLPGGPR